MAIISVIESVALSQRLRADFPGSAVGISDRIMSGVYDIKLDAIQSVVGRWLAEHVTSTRRGDPGSSLRLLLPASKGTEAMGMIAKNIGCRCGLTLANQMEAVWDELDDLKESLDRDEKDRWDQPDCVQYQWPVYGSRAIVAATPEEIFNAVEFAIKKSGGVILDVGTERARPSGGMVHYMAEGFGLDLIARHDAMTAVMA